MSPKDSRSDGIFPNRRKIKRRITRQCRIQTEGVNVMILSAASKPGASH